MLNATCRSISWKNEKSFEFKDFPDFLTDDRDKVHCLFFLHMVKNMCQKLWPLDYYFECIKRKMEEGKGDTPTLVGVLSLHLRFPLLRAAVTASLLQVRDR